MTRLSRHPPVLRRGQGLPLIAVHGNGVDHRILLALDDALAGGGGLERIYLDLPGFGGTPRLPLPGDLPALADRLDAAVDELVGERPFALLGSSLGGLLVRDLAARRPTQWRGMALLAPVIDPDRRRRRLPAPPEPARVDEELLADLAPEDRADFTAVAIRQDRAAWERFRRHVLPGLRAADPEAMDRLESRYALPEDAGRDLVGDRRPVLVLAGRQDAVVGCEDQKAFAARIPGARYVALDGAGHNLAVDRPDAVHRELRRWVGELQDAGPS